MSKNASSVAKKGGKRQQAGTGKQKAPPDQKTMQPKGKNKGYGGY